jgi:YegS/Rv2252/BmrU family lipid kinase
MTQARALVVINRASSRADTDLAPFVQRLEDLGVGVSVEDFDDPKAMADRIRSSDPSHDRIVVGGGDGTMASVAEALRQRGLPVGLLPLGNACDLARSLGIPRDPAGAAEIAATGRPQAIDLGYVNDRPFFNLASLGLSVQVARRLTDETKKRWGVLSYPLMLWDAYHATRPFRVEAVCDGETRQVKTIQLGIGSGYHYGGGMTVSSDARLDDGMLHVYAIEPMSWPQLLLLLPRLWLGRYKAAEQVMIMTGRTIEVRTRSARSINADGEIVTETPATFRIAPGAVTVLVPETREAPGLSP